MVVENGLIFIGESSDWAFIWHATRLYQGGNIRPSHLGGAYFLLLIILCLERHGSIRSVLVSAVIEEMEVQGPKEDGGCGGKHTGS